MPLPEGGAPGDRAMLAARIRAAIALAGGWLPFDRFMAMALYEPGLGYYARDAVRFGRFPAGGSDFVTAPELSPLFGRALAVQVEQALAAAGSSTVVEFGAGSGALAAQLLTTLGERVQRYAIVELSGTLRQQQAGLLERWAGRVEWLDRWPEHIEGVVLGNEVLDAMPVQLLAWDGQRWAERGVGLDAEGRFAWSDRDSPLRPPRDPGFAPGAVTELHTHAVAFVRTLAERLQRGVAFLVDYGFPEHEYYHRQRHAGTLMCHRAHVADTDPLDSVGCKDITAHVDFSAIALAAQDAGLQVAGYTSQARFLLGCGLASLLAGADAAGRADAHKLLAEHEMGELFKVLALARGLPGFDPVGFRDGDRSHTL